MFFNSRSVAFILATILTVLSYSVLSFTIDVDEVTLFIVLLVQFIIVFLLCFLTFEWLFFNEFRKMYQVFDRFQFGSLNKTDATNMNRSMSKDLFSFAQSKQQEIQKLKQLETFRKEFLADISHELKTPIFSAQGFIHTLLDGAVNDPNVRDRFLGKAAKSLDQLDTLIQDLIIISQLETGKIKIEAEQFSLNELLTEIIELLEPKRQLRDSTILIDSYADNIIVFADRNRINQVLKNLIDNAIKYGKNNGQVKISLVDSNKNIQIQIQDDGIGIPENHLDKIFRRFYRVEKSRSKEMGGTGLGLAIVKHIIDAHNTNITVSSVFNEGTLFTFELQKG